MGRNMTTNMTLRLIMTEINMTQQSSLHAEEVIIDVVIAKAEIVKAIETIEETPKERVEIERIHRLKTTETPLPQIYLKFPTHLEIHTMS